MKKIFILLIVLSISLFAQSKYYVLHDTHHDDYYKENGSWTRHEDKALHYVNLQEAKRMAYMLRFNKYDEYSDPAPIDIELAKTKVDWNKLRTDLREILNESAENTDSIICDMHRASNKAKLKADSILDAEIKRIMNSVNDLKLNLNHY